MKEREGRNARTLGTADCAVNESPAGIARARATTRGRVARASTARRRGSRGERVSLQACGSTCRSVTVLPRISPFDFGDRPIYAGQAAQLACMVPVGDTPIEIAWSHEGEALSQFMGYSVGKLGPRTSILLIEPVTPEHGGRYACIASNPSGRALHEATLRVHG